MVKYVIDGRQKNPPLKRIPPIGKLPLGKVSPRKFLSYEHFSPENSTQEIYLLFTERANYLHQKQMIFLCFLVSLN